MPLDSPARMLVDFFPICKMLASLHSTFRILIDLLPVKYYPTWLPGSDFKKDALYVRGLVSDMMDTPYEMVKRKLVYPSCCLGRRNVNERQPCRNLGLLGRHSPEI